MGVVPPARRRGGYIGLRRARRRPAAHSAKAAVAWAAATGRGPCSAATPLPGSLVSSQVVERRVHRDARCSGPTLLDHRSASHGSSILRASRLSRRLCFVRAYFYRLLTLSEPSGREAVCWSEWASRGLAPAAASPCRLHRSSPRIRPGPAQSRPASAPRLRSAASRLSPRARCPRGLSSRQRRACRAWRGAFAARTAPHRLAALRPARRSLPSLKASQRADCWGESGTNDRFGRRVHPQLRL